MPYHFIFIVPLIYGESVVNTQIGWVSYYRFSKPCIGLYRFSRRELVTTETELKAMAAPARAGARYLKAATGMPRVL